MKYTKVYDYVVIGAGISGCSVSNELYKRNKSVLLIDKLDEVGVGTSSVAGAFLSPIIGSLNIYNSLINKSLEYSVNFYKDNFPDLIDNCGTMRIPKDENDRYRFEKYIKNTNLEYEKTKQGYYFSIGSIVKSKGVCNALVENIDKILNVKVNSINYIDNYWITNDVFKSKNIILCLGHEHGLINEDYINIRQIHGCKIDLLTTVKIKENYHKNCSISRSEIFNDHFNKVSIGATHFRNRKLNNVNDDINILLNNALDITRLDNINSVKKVFGTRACSVDYFPMVGSVINSQKTLERFSYIKKGTNVDKKRFLRYNSLFILNGLGGRGFSLAPYLSKLFVDNICFGVEIDPNICIDRLFLKWAKRIEMN